MNFIGLHIQCTSELSEILMAEFSMLPYDTFEENETGFSAYCEEDQFDLETVKDIISRYQPMGEISYHTEQIERINWNEEWEKNYDPVYVGDQVVVKAVFHEIEEKFPYEITINPKMSFGTGHHATTSLILNMQLQIDHAGKKVYDFGSGTGVLAIMAHLLGADDILATDVDDWCIENSQENFGLNKMEAKTLKGPIATLGLSEPADIVLANINKNVLLDEMDHYSDLLKPNGVLFLSGFYESDIDDLIDRTKPLGLTEEKRDTKDNWAVLVLRKASL